MNEPNNKIKLLSKTPIPKALLAMGLPTMIGMMINALYNLADAYFVGGLGTSQMGAITAAYPLGQIIVGLGLLFGNGAASYISRLLGLGDKKAADKTASTALYSSLIVGLAVIICSVIFLRPILKFSGASASIMPYALTYGNIYIISSIFNIFNVTMNNIVSSEGSAKTTMCVLMAGAILNVILDPIFIYTFNLGVAGAAIATALSQIFSTFIYLGYIHKKKSIFSFSIRQYCFSKTTMKEILKIGIPTMIFQLLTSLSIAMINDKAHGYGDSVLAAMGPVTRIMSVGSLMVFGFIKGFQPIAGYSYGAKNYSRLHEAIKISLIWSSVFCVAFGLVMAAFPASIISLFTKNDITMIRVGERALRANGLSFMVFGFYTVYSSLFLALGKAKEGFILGSCRQGICFIPIILLLPGVLKINGIIYAQPVSDVISAVITIFMALHLHKELAAKGN